MSTHLHEGVTTPRDPKQLELVKKIADRTREGKIIWHRSPTEFSANMTGGLSMNFIYSYTVPPPTTIWKLFTVRGAEGVELLRVENNFAGALYTLLRQEPPQPDPIVEAVSVLYHVVDQEPKGDIDRAIAVLDRV